MTLKKLLIANRAEIAIRIARAAAELGIATVAVHSEDDSASLHTRKSDESRALNGSGAAAYLDGEQLVRIAKETGCDAIHPGYGFLSESADFARRCVAAGLQFVGPTPEQLELFGDKLRARALAEELGVPVLRATAHRANLDQAREFFAALGGAPVLIKAVAGGGGRGMRAVRSLDQLAEAHTRCQSEARASFGNPDVYVEELLSRARHVEVQVAGDASGRVIDFGERECSLQRRYQKLVEIAPSPSLAVGQRARLVDAALRLARRARYLSLGTFEFLVDREGDRLVFLEANPRLQVEHPVTEAVFGIDLVQIQLRIAAGATLADLGFGDAGAGAPRGHAIELRVNLEGIDSLGNPTPGGGTIGALELPSGPGVRVDGHGYPGYTTSTSFDPLLLKLIVHSGSRDYADAVAKAKRALAELSIDGAVTNVGFLRSLVAHPRFATNDVHTTFIEQHAAELAREAEPAPSVEAAQGTLVVRAPIRARVVSVHVQEGDSVRRGQELAILESMKMESAVGAPSAGVVRRVTVGAGESIAEGHALFVLEPVDDGGAALATEAQVDLDHIRADLAEVRERHAIGLDAARPDAVAKRRQRGQRTVRENVDDLVDPGSFVEYGALVLAAQRSRRSLDDLIRSTPGDGLVSGIGTVNAELFGVERARCAVAAYDATVLAGTQGAMNHKKQDRLFELAREWRLPVVLCAEGGGGRPGDTDFPLRPHLDVPTFATFASLSGLVPLVGVVSGRCFAGNAALLGCCDVIIATENSNIGMGGPVMIEGAGLGACAPEDVGPIDVQSKNGVVDVRVPDEAAAIAVAKQYLGYFQGSLSSWECADQRLLRRIVPENRLRLYSMREVIETIADTGSMLELRRGWGAGMITALIRLEGRPFGVIANEPSHISGAIDAEAGDKGARFLQLCEAFDLPVISLLDTPGFMVGPEAEKTALVRHVSRLFVAGASLSVPLFAVVIRKAYGLGAMSMAGGGLQVPFITLAWPNAEFGAMGLEGAVLLGLKKQLDAIENPTERAEMVRQMVAALREQGRAVNVASQLELDEVIDPAETRSFIARAARSVPPPERRAGKKRGFVDTW
jgi:acetyl/propionyl-CoA carboxylase alpha subunit